MTIPTSTVSGGHANDAELVDNQNALNALLGVFTNSVMAVVAGGTGIASYAIGDLLYASAATTLSKLADIAKGGLLLSGGVGAAPKWLAAGSSGQLLQSAGASADPTWAGDIAFTAVTFANSWVDFGAPFPACSSQLLADGKTVLLRGVAKTGTATAGTTVATVTAAHRPTKEHRFAGVSNDAFVSMGVKTDGSVYLVSAGNSASLIISATYTLSG